MSVLSEAQQKRVWEGMLSSEIRSNYFADLSGRYYSRQWSATWGALWENVYSDDAQETLSSLDDRSVELSKAGAGFKYDERSMLRWQEQVERHRLAHA